MNKVDIIVILVVTLLGLVEAVRNKESVFK